MDKNFSQYASMKNSFITPSLHGTQRSEKKEPQSRHSVQDYLLCLARTREENDITKEQVMQHLNFSSSTLMALEKGQLEFIQYPLNYFFARQYAQYLKVPFPDQFLMVHFKPGEKKWRYFLY